MKKRRTAGIAVVCLLACVASTPAADTFASVADAVSALSSSNSPSAWNAVEYLTRHPEEAVPRLMGIVERKEKGWIHASAALTRTKDERVAPFYINLLRNNYYEKEKDGTRKQFGLGTKNGCEVWPFLYGGVLARALGTMGDKRAIPVLKEAAKEGDSEVRRRAYEALYKLEALSLDDLFDMAKKDADPQANVVSIIEGIGWASIHSDTPHALKVFDRIIAELPKHEQGVAGAHFWKVQCFTLLKQYDRAIQECDEVMKFPQNASLIAQVKTKREALRLLSEENARQETNRLNPVPEDPARKLAEPQR